MSTEEDEYLSEEVGVTLDNTVLYNAMIHPFTRMVIKGALWYQGSDLSDTTNFFQKIDLGEYNSGINRDKYNCTFPKLIESWRAIWHARTNSSTDPTFPFGFVQVDFLCFDIFFVTNL